MMTTGKIPVCRIEGLCLILYGGDVRLTLCAALDAYTKAFQSRSLLQRESLSRSTEPMNRQHLIGAVAKLSLLSKQKSVSPTWCPNQET